MRAQTRDLNTLVLAGLLDKSPQGYVVSDYDRLAVAVAAHVFEETTARARRAAALASGQEPPLPPGSPPDLFSEIVGYPERQAPDPDGDGKR